MKTIQLEIKNNKAYVKLNRPDVRNAFNEEMIEEMRQCFESLKSNQDIRCVVLGGEGASFCAGGDLNWMKSMVNYSQKENVQDSVKLYEMYQALKDIPVPVITLVHGHAMGGALGLIAASDIVLAETETQLCFSEVRLGLAPAVISAFVKDKILPRDMSRYFLTAEVFNAQRGFEMGLIHEFGTLEDMKNLLEKIAKKIGNNGPRAVRETKKMISDLADGSKVKERTTELIADLRVSPEGQEGLAAFFEKRKPSWLEKDNHGN